MKFLKLLIVPFVVLALLVTGCQTAPSGGRVIDIQKVVLVAQLASYNGTFLFLSKNADQREKFVLASKSLTALIENGVSVEGLVAILNGLPIKELKSTEGKLLIDNAVVLFGVFFDSTVTFNELEKMRDLKLVAAAIKAGIDKGLDSVE